MEVGMNDSFVTEPIVRRVVRGMRSLTNNRTIIFAFVAPLRCYAHAVFPAVVMYGFPVGATLHTYGAKTM